MEAWNEVAIKFKPVAEYDSTSLCEAFVRTYTVRLKTDHAFFRHFVLTIFNLFRTRHSEPCVCKACSATVQPFTARRKSSPTATASAHVRLPCLKRFHRLKAL